MSSFMSRLVATGFVPDLDRVQAENLQGSLSTAQVAAWFKSRCSGLVFVDEDQTQWAPWDQEDWPGSETWAPAAQESFAKVTIDGDLGPVLAISSDYNWSSNQYEWFDLDQVPFGGYLLRVSATGTAWFFGRKADGSWRAYAFPHVG